MQIWYFLRVTIHLVAGILTCALLFPWVSATRRDYLIKRWSAKLLAICTVDVRFIAATNVNLEEAVRAARRAPVAPLWRRPGRSGAGVHSLTAAEQENSRHTPGVSAFVLVFDEPLDWFGFSDGLALLLQVLPQWPLTHISTSSTVKIPPNPSTSDKCAHAAQQLLLRLLYSPPQQRALPYLPSCWRLARLRLSAD